MNLQEVRSTGAGLISAAFVAIVPSYISRSVAGSYDNEGVAIFALMFVFFLYIKVRSNPNFDPNRSLDLAPTLALIRPTYGPEGDEHASDVA